MTKTATSAAAAVGVVASSSKQPIPRSSSHISPSKSGGYVGSPAPPEPTSLDSEQHKHIEKHLRSHLAALQKREPLDPSYDSLLPVSYRKHARASANANKAAEKGGEGSKQAGKKSNVLSADVKLHRRLNANLRSIVETYASTPAGWRRRPNTRRIEIDFGSSNSDGNAATAAKNDEIESKLRAAFALRESKEHEQRDLVNATLKAENAKLRRGWGFSQVTGAGGAGVGAAAGAAPMAGMLPPLEEASVRKKRLEGIAKQLREKEKGAADRARWMKIALKGKGLILNPESATKDIVSGRQPGTQTEGTTIDAKPATNADPVREAKRKRVDPEQERQAQIVEAKKRERVLRERLEREEAENKRQIEKEREERERRERALETPRDALHRLYEPIFSALWDMEFPALGGTNPFRMVIDASTCADMGVPDYCEIIKKPMNLTFVQTKVNNKSYESLQEFLEDVDLIVKNALQYNSHPNNPYHIAAKGFQKKFRKLARPLVKSLTKGMAPK
mmetsp:Transcript_23166/g.49567  ORF Transcript_23166/g.49567 Transcript_23166/m.49567 type:complete len:506 (+) Transcript_23166:32-1549(+)